MSTIGSTSSSSGTTGTAGSTTNTASATGLGTDFRTFLTLLTTQLQNQDPSNAMDVNEMTNQLVQFSAVEQQIQANTNLSTLISLQQGASLTTASSLLGKTVEVEANQIPLQNGVGTLRLPAAGTASAARIVITNSSGTVLRDTTVALGTGTTDWSWNGLNTAGQRMGDGAYNISVTGIGSDGSTSSLTPTVVGTVTGANRTSSGVNLTLGGLTVGFDAMRTIRN
jgi:flagellar basal-body rod modification protein FlgD